MPKWLKTPGNLQNLQRTLYCKSKADPSFRFYSLWDKVYRTDVLHEAWRRVKANQGASGVDAVTITAIEQAGVEPFLTSLQADLRTKTYQSASLRRVWIPKASGGQRPLGIPTVRDRVAQMAVTLILTPIFEAEFCAGSYGFRPGKSAHQAVREVMKFLNWGLVQVVDADIRDCFGQIPHAPLLRVLAKRVADGQVLRVIRQWLRAGVMDDGRKRGTMTGTPQGGVISPLLANAYLNELDRYWATQGYAIRRGWNAQLVRYADDLVILTDKAAGPPLDTLHRMLAGLGLALHPEKTRLVNADQEAFDFLGFNFRKRWNRQRTKRFTLMLPSKKAQQGLRDKVRELTRYERTVPVQQVIQDLNPVLRGWVNYFGAGHASGAFHKVRHYVRRKIMRYVRKKQLRPGFGWQTLTSEVLYGRWGLFYEYRVSWGAKTHAC